MNGEGKAKKLLVLGIDGMDPRQEPKWEGCTR